MGAVAAVLRPEDGVSADHLLRVDASDRHFHRAIDTVRRRAAHVAAPPLLDIVGADAAASAVPRA